MLNIDEKRFCSIILEMIENNPFSVRPVLKIAHTVFTDKIPTLAVTCAERPQLLVNLSFIRRHCSTEDQVKALICHEFLHIVLRHTERFKKYTPAIHLAMDSVINAIIHRQYGSSYSAMMSSYYAKAKGLMRLLRPPEEKESLSGAGLWLEGRDADYIFQQLWEALYSGLLVADDIAHIAEEAETDCRLPLNLTGDLLGNHNFEEKISAEMSEALDRAIREMNGNGIWRMPKSRGIGSNPYDEIYSEDRCRRKIWEKKTMELLRLCLLPDKKSYNFVVRNSGYTLPVLNMSDRRAFLKAGWSPFMPEAFWKTERPVRDGTANVYLDVSGSMNHEMPALVTLLTRLSHYIRHPLWAFSDSVAPAVIEKGMIKSATSGGTSMSCVLEHLAAEKPAAALVITDGYIEEISSGQLRKIQDTDLRVLVSSYGSTCELERAGFKCRQLEEIP